MTWFLDRIAEKVPGLGAPLPSGLEQAFGGLKDSYIRTDAWARKQGFENELFDEMLQAAGGIAKPGEMSADEQLNVISPTRRVDWLLDRAKNVIRLSPETWGELPQDRAAFDREVQRRRTLELQENADMLARGDSPLAQTAGKIVGAMSDETSLPFLFMGGSVAKGLGRLIAIEFALGGAAEVPAVIKERQVAADLGFEPGNAAAQIATGAAFGGVFGALLGGGARAIEYLRGRRVGEAQATGSLDDALDTNRAEEALRRGGEPPPPNWNAIKNGIFAGESGGDYDALFAFSNRPGGPFADVKLTEMTVDEAIAFSDPSGPYAQWVKDQIGRVATPMGGYQVVGTTLRAALKGLGLKGDELMTPALQDRIGQWIYRQQGTGAWEGYAGPRDAFQGDTSGPYRGVSGGATDRRGPVIFDEVSTPAGRRIPVKYRVVDLSELKPATGDLQPRDRSRAASDDQVTKIAAQLNPRRLMPGPESQTGAPVIGRDGIIESGNGRVQALGRAAEQNPQAYHGYVEAIRAAGYDIPEGVKRPVLVAERTDNPTLEDRLASIRESNTSSTARMAATEQAASDAKFLTGPVFDAYQPGRRIGGTENAGFVRRFLGQMTAEERGALLTRDGALNAEGLRRVRGALFARAFGAEDLLRLAVETENRAVTNLVRMLEDLAPDWAAFRAMVEAGYVRPEFDITGQLMDAVRLIARARIDDRDGQSVIAAIRDRLAQADMFAEADPLTEALVDVFYRGDRARGPEVSGDILARYAGKAVAIGRADTADLVEAVTPEAALRRAIDEEEKGLPAEALPARTAPPDAPAEVAAFDPAPLTDGAASPAVQAADDALAAELQAEAPGPFGPVYSGFTGDPEGAIAKIMAEGDGEVADAFVHPELGPIAFVHGKTDPKNPKRDFGLVHILEKHGPDMLRRVPEILRQGEVRRAPTGFGKNRAYIQAPGDPAPTAVIRLDYDDKEKAWLVTAFDDVEGVVARQLRTSNEQAASVSSRIPDTTGQAKNSAQAPAPQQADDITAAIAEARANAPDDLTITLNQGGEAETTVTARDVLNNIEAEANLENALKACRITGGRA